MEKRKIVILTAFFIVVVLMMIAFFVRVNLKEHLTEGNNQEIENEIDVLEGGNESENLEVGIEDVEEEKTGESANVSESSDKEIKNADDEEEEQMSESGNASKNSEEEIENAEEEQVSEIDSESESSEKESENMDNRKEAIKINLIVNNKNFTTTLNNSKASEELLAMLPITLNMGDLNSNEKYNYLNFNFTTNSAKPNKINAGDIKLYGNNCIVIFYKSFNTSYSYTDLGKVDDVEAFVDELGSGSVNIRFEEFSAE